MKISRFIVMSTIAATLVAASGACSSSSTSSRSSSSTAVNAPAASSPATSPPEQAPVTTTAPVVTNAASVAPPQTGYFADVYTEICAIDRQTLELGVEVYVAMNGAGDVAEAELVAADVLREESEYLDIGPGNIVVATAAGPCTG